ncbi:MAG TPA: pyridoxamine 5'-phosphate oxidase family protein [Terriglobia bacterium]|nr:pyridoxamine 5'-phosphate oxidase family protein [Terriglobia bacterium]
MIEPAAEIRAVLDQLAEEAAASTGPLRLAALATIAGHEPQVRHVIIRSFSRPTLRLVFFCRADDAKFGEIASHPAVELVSYVRGPDRQLRLAGTAANLTDAQTLDDFWRRVRPTARGDYVFSRNATDAETTAGALPGDDSRAPLFRAVEVTIRRVKLLTFENERWIERSFLPSA